MKKLLMILLFAMSSVAFGQSKLPPCQGTDTKYWDKCQGTFTVTSGNKYVGEWKDGKRNGQGTFTFANGDKYVGEYKNGKQNGQGTYTFANGTKSVGVWKDGERIEQSSEYARLERLEREQQEQSIPLRAKARNDVVAQALNYVDGGGENIDGRIVWLPTHRSNGDCIFKQIGGYGESVIDLNRGNPNAIEFVTDGDSYFSKVDGLPTLYCKLDTNCIGTRVRRAWALIYKECKGTRKAF